MMKIFLYLLIAAFTLSIMSCQYDPDATIPGDSNGQDTPCEQMST
ncbi:hypothetical protein A6C57_26150 [Fibrella sp. ES10-3-2-2]